MRKICTFTKIEFKYISLHRMENKKLLKFLLKDLSELDELFAGKGTADFDDLEMEFFYTRIKGAKKLVQILFDRENNTQNKTEVVQKEEIIEELAGNPEIQEKIEVEPIVEKLAKAVEEKVVQQEEELVAEIQPEVEVVPEVIEKMEVELPDEVELEEETVVDEANQRLGDRFSKEKSFNDLMAAESTNLEHKLSNRPVTSIQKVIGINDRFQYIRELFDGNANDFTKTVSEIDAMQNIKEAVRYLQQNFKWKKNETSLKFVNLVKRRFPNE